MPTLLLTLALVHLLACLIGYRLVHHVIRAWHTAALARTPVASAAGWHPVVVSRSLHRVPPRAAATPADWTELYQWALIPGLNIVLLCVVFGCVALERLQKAWPKMRQVFAS